MRHDQARKLLDMLEGVVGASGGVDYGNRWEIRVGTVWVEANMYLDETWVVKLGGYGYGDGLYILVGPRYDDTVTAEQVFIQVRDLLQKDQEDQQGTIQSMNQMLNPLGPEDFAKVFTALWGPNQGALAVEVMTHCLRVWYRGHSVYRNYSDLPLGTSVSEVVTTLFEELVERESLMEKVCRSELLQRLKETAGE